MLFDPASPGDARDAVRRLKHYYVHAQKGGGLSYLHREHLSASWTVWKFQTQAARATGVLKAFKNSAKNLRKDAKNMLRSWRALAWLGTLEGQAHSEMTLLRAKTFMSNVRRSIQLGEAPIDRQRRRRAVRRWRARCTADVGARAARALMEVALPVRGRQNLQRWALRAWHGKCADKASLSERIAKYAASELALLYSASARQRNVLQVWSLQAETEKVLRLARRIIARKRSLPEALTFWRRDAEAGLIAMLTEQLDVRLPPDNDPIVKARRFITEWRFKQRRAWRSWHKWTYCGWGMKRVALLRWKRRAAVSKRVHDLEQAQRDRASLGLTYTSWRQRAAVVRQARGVWDRGEEAAVKRRAKLLMAGIRERHEQAGIKEVGERFAKVLAWRHWRDSLDRSIHRATHIQTVKMLILLFDVGRAFTTWRRSERRKSDIAESVQSVMDSRLIRALHRWAERKVVEEQAPAPGAAAPSALLAKRIRSPSWVDRLSPPPQPGEAPTKSPPSDEKTSHKKKKDKKKSGASP